MKRVTNYLFLIVALLIVVASGCSSSKKTVATKTVAPAQGNFKNGLTWTPGDMEFSEKFIESIRQEEESNNQQAISLLNECLAIKPDDGATNYELSKIYYNQQKYDAALAYARIAAKRDPDNEWYAQQLADALGATNKFKEAADAYGDYLKRNPNNTERYYDWAYYLTKAGKYADAIQAYDKIENQIGLNPDVSQEKERLYLKMGKTDKAIDEVNKLIANNPNEPSYYAMLADLYSANNMDDKAMEALQKLIQIDPYNPDAQLALCNYYTKKGDSEKAFEALKSAFENPNLDLDEKIKILYPTLAGVQTDPVQRRRMLELGKIITKTNPESAKAYDIYGDIFNQAYMLDSALIEYKKSIVYDSSDFKVVLKIMALDFQMGHTDSLYKDSKLAVSLFPDETYSYYYNGVADMQKKQWQDAVEVFSKGVKIGSDDKEVMTQMYADMGDACNSLKEYHTSDSAFEMALVFDPNNANALNDYAYYLSLRDENLDKAEAMSKKSIGLVPNNAAFEDTYAWIFYKEKKYSDAKTWEDKSLQHGGSNDPGELDHYGDILYQLGDVDGAVKYWKMAKDLHVDSAVIDKKITDRKLYE
jgi:tetratricopeptide (TPR) repeat protein